MMPPLTFYCGINEKRWNREPCQPGPYACISPVYGAKESTRRTNSVRVPPDAQIIQDSGAFSDGPAYRLSFAAALDRQIQHAARYGYAAQITHRASYDLLIDEKWQDGTRSKHRWSEAEAEAAVAETVEAAKFLAARRNGIGLVLSAQGVSPRQYQACVAQVLPLLDNGRDILGLGGWCVTGKFPRSMMPVFCATMRLVIPQAARAGVKRVHVWGVLHAPALAVLLYECDRYSITLSTDSAGPSRRPAFGQWGYADWSDIRYQRPPVETRGLERARHVEAVRAWLAGFRSTRYYRALSEPHAEQLQLF